MPRHFSRPARTCRRPRTTRLVPRSGLRTSLTARSRADSVRPARASRASSRAPSVLGTRAARWTRPSPRSGARAPTNPVVRAVRPLIAPRRRRHLLGRRPRGRTARDAVRLRRGREEERRPAMTGSSPRARGKRQGRRTSSSSARTTTTTRVGFAEVSFDLGPAAATSTASRGRQSAPREKNVAKDAGDSNARGGGEKAELTPKQVEEQRKREEDTVRMLEMGVPEVLTAG